MGQVLSGVQPTGNLHLGNYLGAIKNWVKMQDEHNCLFCIVDLHAITVPQDPKELLNNTRNTAAAYIACGIDPKKSVIFHQSSVPEHSELAWLLSTVTPLGWLNRMTQFKEKAGKHKDLSCLALYSYPVLMAADILLYKATHVPVGEDQKQHLELTRDIAGAFNHQYNKEYFALPEPIILGEATRVMSLRDGTKKMSKSEESDNSRINLTDDDDTIVKKIKKAKSDMVEGVTYNVEERPEASNLLNIYSAMSGEKRTEIEKRYASAGFAKFKSDLAEVVVENISPIRNEIQKLQQDKSYLDDILRNGTETARKIANNSIGEIKDIMGLLKV
ncbi:MAG: tryptophan--tRNA ligase [Rickettsiales bacterium]|nr:tryptophan--tRNA ligase [Pseudomonadota bacterium]MDA0965673.1 tryptophan--tRNA ligase [Pseudomonadota bacterium]MDG4542997.1 tryptophan--tRNA ligase [Rickettsiales bacterium]MDG4544555.1 tryptophan--tRNA ligase [Rickettsiales bacterium]MDG4546677.1 tryptophan--tRNA ligase [Rickettsiales bacterium]